MKQSRVSFILPLSAFIGTVFGVGLYSLPYVMSVSGIWLFLAYLVIVGMLVYLVNVMFAEVAMLTPTRERMLGYVGQFFGKRVETMFGWTSVVSFWGIRLVYLLIFGQFAFNVFQNVLPFTPIIYSTFFFVITLIIFFREGETVESLDIVMLCVAGLLMLILFATGVGKMEHLILLPTKSIGSILPYGTLMFAMWGAGIIPEVVNQLRKNPKQIARLLRIGMLVPAFIYVLFALFVVSLSGTDTSRESFSGLQGLLGTPAVIIGSLIGMITITLAYVNLGWVTRSMLKLDLHFSHVKSMVLSLIPPFLLLILGFHNFIIIISIVGSIFLGVQGIMIFSLYKKTHHGSASGKPHILNKAIPKIFIKIGITLFIAGVFVELGVVLYEELLSVIE